MLLDGKWVCRQEPTDTSAGRYVSWTAEIGEEAREEICDAYENAVQCFDDEKTSLCADEENNVPFWSFDQRPLVWNSVPSFEKLTPFRSLDSTAADESELCSPFDSKEFCNAEDPPLMHYPSFVPDSPRNQPTSVGIDADIWDKALDFLPLSETAFSQEIMRCDSPVRLFVGRIPKTFRNSRLRAPFAAIGEVLQCNIIRDKHTGKSRGCGFVRFARFQDGLRTVHLLNQKIKLNPDLGAVQVKFASGELSRLGMPSNLQPGVESIKCFVGNLGPKILAEDLAVLFEPFAPLEETFVLQDPVKNESKCSGFVTFSHTSNAMCAIRALNEKIMLPGATRLFEIRIAQSRGQNINDDIESGIRNNVTPVLRISTKAPKLQNRLMASPLKTSPSNHTALRNFKYNSIIPEAPPDCNIPKWNQQMVTPDYLGSHGCHDLLQVLSPISSPTGKTNLLSDCYSSQTADDHYFPNFNSDIPTAPSTPTYFDLLRDEIWNSSSSDPDFVFGENSPFWRFPGDWASSSSNHTFSFPTTSWPNNCNEEAATADSQCCYPSASSSDLGTAPQEYGR